MRRPTAGATIAKGIFVIAWATSTAGFTVPSSSIAHRPAPPQTGLALMMPSSPTELSQLTTSPLTTIVVADAVEIVKNVFLTVGVIVALLFGTALIFSTFVIPKAAEQLENQARDLDPELWDEYQAKLGPNEILAMRPELMQELGDKVRAKMIAKFEEAEQRQQQQARTPTTTTPPKDDLDSGVIEAEIVSKDRKEE